MFLYCMKKKRQITVTLQMPFFNKNEVLIMTVLEMLKRIEVSYLYI